jgi:cellulose synthase/poly-beta-1,6-N-acetylglucosamine synthase-like glycosyltransferase
MIFVFYFFAAILILLSFKSFRGGVEYLRFFKAELSKPRPGHTPFVTVIAPCRGLDKGLAENLRALVEQNYPEYEIVFVVDDKNDAAVPVIEEISRESAVKAKLIIAPKAAECGQKVESLREAVLHAADRSQAFVFVDSDARPSSDWLRYLVAPLSQEEVGAATGYRWFISKDPSFASEMLSAWNASIASALGPNTKTNFCWGGSTAIRRDVFDRIDMREKWRGTLSDDFALTRAVKEAGLSIVFVPNALTASVENCSFRELLEFTTRQMKITRVYAPQLWLLSFFGSALFVSVMKAAFLIEMFRQTTDFAVFAALAMITLVTIFSTAKAWLRLKAVKLVLTKYKTELDRQFWPQITFWLLTPALFFYNSFAALLSRRMTWRGITYELKSPVETVIIAD